MKPIEKFIEGMKSADNSAYTLKQLITKLSLITKDIATDTETAPKVIKIGSSTDVTSVFNQVKVGDMIKYGDTRLYIIAAMDDNDDIDLSAFVIDYTNDCFGYWYYEKQENTWIINEDISFTIYKSSLGGGTKLYKHSIVLPRDNNSPYSIEVISASSSVITSISTLQSLINNSIKSSNSSNYVFRATTYSGGQIDIWGFNFNSNTISSERLDYAHITAYNDTVTEL